jgi:hypothetical protein
MVSTQHDEALRLCGGQGVLLGESRRSRALFAHQNFENGLLFLLLQ